MLNLPDPGDVANLIPVSYATRSVSLSWTSSQNPEGYRLTITSTETEDPEPILIDGAQSMYTVDDLMPGTEYNFLLEAYVNVSGSLSYGDGQNVTQRTSKTLLCISVKVSSFVIVIVICF